MSDWIVKSASAERDWSNGDYTAIVVIHNDEAEVGQRYRQGYGEGPTWREAIATAERVARAEAQQREGAGS